MKLQAIGTKILTNKYLLKGLEKVSEHSTSFGAVTSLAMALTVRPLVIMATPDTEKENKQYAASNSICSGLIKFGMVEAIALPLEYAIKKIDKNPEKYLNKETVKNLLGETKSTIGSKSYKVLTQAMKLSVGFITAIPKSILTVALIPVVMDKVFGNKFLPGKTVKKQEEHGGYGKVNSEPFFGGTGEKITKGVGKIINNKSLQKLAIRFQDSDRDIAKHMTAATDTLLTATAVYQTDKSNSIKQDRKKALIYNNVISTAVTIAGGYLVDGIMKKSTERFIEKFKNLNTDYKNISKCVEGINIIRPAIIFAVIYYGVLPIFSTYLSEKIDKFIAKKHS